MIGTWEGEKLAKGFQEASHVIVGIGNCRHWLRSLKMTWEANQGQCPTGHLQGHHDSDTGLEKKLPNTAVPPHRSQTPGQK